jgi:hypothetical protein
MTCLDFNRVSRVIIAPVASLSKRGLAAELAAMVNLAWRLLALEKPRSSLLEPYGATEAEARAVQGLREDIATASS